MHDVFQPVARVMSLLQGISLLPWKTYPYIQKLAKWLRYASVECHEYGNMEYFPMLNGNIKVYYFFLYINSLIDTIDI